MIDLRIGDSAVVLTHFDADSIDLTVTSPPYDNLRKYNGYTFDFETIARQLYRVTKPGGVVVWVVGDATIDGSETLTSVKQKMFFRELGFNIHDTMIYERDNFAKPDNKRYWSHFEYMFVFSKGKPKTVNLITDRLNSNRGKKITKPTVRENDGKTTKRKPFVIQDYGKRSNVWFYNVGYGRPTLDKIAYQHPAIFPEALARDHILSWSNEGDTVLDPFMGSGTTGKMAVLNNRNFIGIDISYDYFVLTQRRIGEAIR